MYKILSDETANLTYTFIDFETGNTALHEVSNLPWQAAFITIQNGIVVKECERLIKWTPLAKVSKGAAYVTKYDESKVIQNGLPPDVVYDEFLEEIQAADRIVGHNIILFDIYVWEAWARAIGKTPYNFIPKAIDTAGIAKGLKLETKPKDDGDFLFWQYRSLHTRKKGLKFSLESLGKEFGIKHNYEKLHDALVDLQLNVKVFDQLKYGVII
jgi:DNA polymerase III epsilon subunit-like protein